MEYKKENKRIFEAARDHLNDAQIKNSESFDRAILTLSSAGLALTLSLTKVVVSIDEAVYLCALHLAWGCFSLAIISTILSFLSSNKAIAKEREHIYEYYINENNKYENAENTWGIITYRLNRLSAIVFIIGMLSTVTYVWANTQKEDQMTTTTEEKGYVPPKQQPAEKPSQTSKPSDTNNSGKSKNS